MTVHEKLAQVQQGLKAPKGQFNSFGKYKYRSCEDILEAVKPLLGAAKATLTISDDIDYVGDRYYIVATASFTDAESGEVICVEARAREEQDKKGMDGSQITGTASSYARKYALNGLFCIDDTKDSDATNTHGKAESKVAPCSCTDCGGVISSTINRDGSEWSAEDVVTYSKRRFERALCPDCQKKAFAAEKA